MGTAECVSQSGKKQNKFIQNKFIYFTMEKLLETTDEFDVELFDSVIRVFYNPGDKEHKRAENVLLQFREHPDSWARTAVVMKESKDVRSKAFAVQVLERTVKVRWNLLTEEQQAGAREYVVDKMLELAMSTNSESKLLVKQFNQVLIEVIKREWPEKWPTLITDLLDASKGNSGVCANSFNLLALLCDVVFNFHESLVKERVVTLQKQMKNEFPGMYDIVVDILDKVSTGEISVPSNLVVSSLKLLIIVIPNISPEYLFEHRLVEIVSRYIESEFIEPAVHVLRSVLERGEDAPSSSAFGAVLKRSFVVVSAFFERYCDNFNKANVGGIQAHYETFSLQDTNIIREIVLFYGVAYKYVRDLEKMQCNVIVSLSLMLQISQVQDFELFRLCLDFWSTFVKDLFLEFPFVPAPPKMPAGLRRTHYSEILASLVPVLVAQMQRPEEVIIVENEDKEIVLEKLVDTEYIEHHKEMTEVLYNISAMTQGGLGPYFCNEMEKLKGSWTREKLSKLSWAAGSIEGTSSTKNERDFVVQIIHTLLSMCEQSDNEGDRAIVASCLMYILARNPEYLKSYPSMLEAITKKMFEFIVEVDLVGVAEMACDTLLKIMSSCSHLLSAPLSSGKECIFMEIFPVIPKILDIFKDKPYLSEVLFEALSYISADYIEKLLQEPSMTLFMPDLATADGVMKIVHSIRLVKVVCSVEGSEELCENRETVIGKITGQVQYIYDSIQSNSPQTSPMLNRNRQILRKEIIGLYTVIAQKFSISFILGDFIRLCETVISSPIRTGNSVCSVESLYLLAELCKRTVEGASPIVEEVIGPVAVYITNNPEEKEEHIKAFYKMLCASVRSKPQVNSIPKIEWLAMGVGNQNREICEDSIEVLSKVIEKTSIEIIREGFLGLLECILGAALDKDHEGGMSSLLVSLSLLIRYSIEEKCPSQNQVLDIFGGKLLNIFPHINPKDIEEFIYRCYRDVNSHEGLLENINDFRVKIKTV